MNQTSTGSRELSNLTLLLRLGSEFFQEMFYGISRGTIPWHYSCGIGAFFSIIFATRLDILLWKYSHLWTLYPSHPFFYWIYVFVFISSGFWGWGIFRVVARHRLISRLTSVFQNAGLQTRTGRLPGFVSDLEMDSHLRKLIVTSAGIPKTEFDRAKPYLGAELQVHIDEIKSRIERGTVEILYAHGALQEKVLFDRAEITRPLQFKVGQTRSGALCVSLKDVPHILVGGYTNSGKSTFLRQLLTTLFLNDSDIEFTLIDLKRGLEFQIFEGLPKARIYIDAAGAIRALDYVEKQLEKRMSLLKANKVNDLGAFYKIPAKEQIFPSEWKKQKSISRHVVVIDEAAELFLASATLAGKDAQVARRLASKIAALGRAVGIHLIIATQRPDRNAVDPLIKTNLQGRLCFQMADNASSMTILDSVRAADLPPVRGRAIWRSGFELVEVQVPLLERSELENLLKERLESLQVTSGNETDLLSSEPSSVEKQKAPDEIELHDESLRKEH